MLIVFEGIDGVGKTTQVKRSVKYLVDRRGGDLVRESKDLGGSTLGEELRRIMYEVVPPRDMAPGVLDLIFLTGHLQNWHKRVKPWLLEGRTVVSDRWWLSQFAYMVAREYDVNVAELFHKLRGPWPTVCIYMWGDPAVLNKRANERPDATKHQKQKPWNYVDLQLRVHDQFRRLYSGMPGWKEVCVDGKDEDTVCLEIQRILDEAIIDRARTINSDLEQNGV